MHKIFAIALNLHDQNTYDGVYHNQRERHTRFKHNLPYHADAYLHQSDILNTNDYRLNNEFVKELVEKLISVEGKQIIDIIKSKLQGSKNI